MEHIDRLSPAAVKSCCCWGAQDEEAPRKAGITPCSDALDAAQTHRHVATTEPGNCTLGSSEPLPLTLFASGPVISSDALRFKCHQEDRDNAFCS
ncbi:Hypp2626 [Branchiostoma lanceolatum]|uniref:Hypp2626 protein n=1 Tax=Branchiostoma lanceolatum TaxID=7740 RepID=A0A8J9ZT46_BRALA|nr:Hypp2626 [Branchiostoma lanceolatum]